MSSPEIGLPEDSSVATAEEPKVKLNLDVKISDTGPCRKHLKVGISREDIERTFGKMLGDFAKDAIVPGFRPGKAPRQLVERRFRKDLADRVKGQLLMETLQQLDDDYKLNPITQPELDLEAVVLPDDGPMEFELDLEVPPDFELPDYSTLTVERPVKSVDEKDVDDQVRQILEKDAQVVPKLDGKVERGDFAVAKLTFEIPGGEPVVFEEEQFRVFDDLHTQDGVISGIGKALEGAKAGEARKAEFTFGPNFAKEDLRGKSGKVDIEVLDLKHYRQPELTPEVLQAMGYNSLGDLRDLAHASLERQLQFRQRESMRKQVLDQLMTKVQFDLPPDLVSRQQQGILARRVLELRQAGLSDQQIGLYRMELLANAQQVAIRSLKEYFLLSKIADAEEIEVVEDDFDAEIEAIAASTGESPRRLRARLEKDGLLEGLGSQILERKALAKVLEKVQVKDTPMTEPSALNADLIDREVLAAEATPAEGEEKASAEG